MATRQEILDAARRVGPTWGSKAWICQVAAELGVTVAALRADLVRAHREDTRGGILTRCDLVQAAPPDLLAASVVRDLNAEFHFVEVR